MKKSTLTPQDRTFLIKIAKSVDGVCTKQKATDTKLTTIDHNVHALHTRINKIEAQLNDPGMYVIFKELMPGFTNRTNQTKLFEHAWLFPYVITASIHGHCRQMPHESASDSRGYEHSQYERGGHVR